MIELDEVGKCAKAKQILISCAALACSLDANGQASLILSSLCNRQISCSDVTASMNDGCSTNCLTHTNIKRSARQLKALE